MPAALSDQIRWVGWLRLVDERRESAVNTVVDIWGLRAWLEAFWLGDVGSSWTGPNIAIEAHLNERAVGCKLRTVCNARLKTNCRNVIWVCCATEKEEIGRIGLKASPEAGKMTKRNRVIWVFWTNKLGSSLCSPWRQFECKNKQWTSKKWYQWRVAYANSPVISFQVSGHFEVVVWHANFCLISAWYDRPSSKKWLRKW
jgi:hypothetical protein